MARAPASRVRVARSAHAPRDARPQCTPAFLHHSYEYEYEYTTKDEYEFNNSVKKFKSIICYTLTEKLMRYRILYIMQSKLPLERKERFMTRATDYSSVISVSSLWFSEASTSQLIVPPAMKANCTERQRRKSAGTCTSTCTRMSECIFQIEFYFTVKHEFSCSALKLDEC